MSIALGKTDTYIKSIHQIVIMRRTSVGTYTIYVVLHY